MFATKSDAVSEWAWNVGHYPRFIDSAWLNHDWDVWVKNPHYTGPVQPHPEDVACGDEDTVSFAPVAYQGDLFEKNFEEFDDIPF